MPAERRKSAKLGPFRVTESQLAEAKRTEMKNEAMKLAGADKMVALKMAEVLNGLDTNPTLTPTKEQS